MDTRKPRRGTMLRRLSAISVITALLVGMIQGGYVSAQHASEVKNLPTLRILSPANGATVRSPVVVLFQTPADLSKMTMGAHMVEETAPHLHVDLDKRITMPTVKQLTKVGANRYRFNLGKAKPGQHTIRIYWADAEAHKPMGPVQIVTITIK